MKLTITTCTITGDMTAEIEIDEKYSRGIAMPPTSKSRDWLRYFDHCFSAYEKELAETERSAQEMKSQLSRSGRGDDGGESGY